LALAVPGHKDRDSTRGYAGRYIKPPGNLARHGSRIPQLIRAQCTGLRLVSKDI